MSEGWSPDGAHLGLTPDQGLKAVLGSEQSEVPEMSPERMASYLESAPDEPQSYDDGGRWAGRGVLHYLQQHPEAFSNMQAGEVFDLAFPHEEGKLDEAWPQIGGITGYLVGWAVNAARYALGHNPTDNPAIIMVEVGEP